jgi:hypothetical protein
LFNSILCGLAVAVVRDLLIPLGTVFSYELHRFVEQLRYNSHYAEAERQLALGIYRCCAFPTVFFSAPLAYRVAVGRGRKFKEETQARINYYDGLRSYMKEYGKYDLVMSVIVTTLLWIVPLGVYLSPVSTMLYGVIPPIFGWLLSVAVAVVTVPVGVFFVQRRWRAEYICDAME